MWTIWLTINPKVSVKIGSCSIIHSGSWYFKSAGLLDHRCLVKNIKSKGRWKKQVSILSISSSLSLAISTSTTWGQGWFWQPRHSQPGKCRWLNVDWVDVEVVVEVVRVVHALDLPTGFAQLAWRVGAEFAAGPEVTRWIRSGVGLILAGRPGINTDKSFLRVDIFAVLGTDFG